MSQTATRTWMTGRSTKKLAIPEGLWLRCPGCAQLIYRKQMEANLHVCPECGHHYRIGAVERVRQLSDPDSFESMFTDLHPTDPLAFTDLKSYPSRLAAEQAKKEEEELKQKEAEQQDTEEESRAEEERR